ncbi:hypothetical protein U9M48_010078 [Paspalum notatum var. saurae]|uniref:Pre-rRNA-processing protein TSR2 n=1 Tax=Paspalum notatum var. saurae TaxID=547442 RepID=A0AAQ3SSR8_PASNO
MAASNGGGPISAEARAALGEAIGLMFGRWTALQMAVENQWGGRESRAKADQLGESILSWFCDSKGPHYFEDLADMMDDQISESFNADFEDDSIEEVFVSLSIHFYKIDLHASFFTLLSDLKRHVKVNRASEEFNLIVYETLLHLICPQGTFKYFSCIQVAKQLLIIHEECLQNNYSSIEKLRNSHVQGNAVAQSRQIAAEDSDSSDDDESMMEDEAAPGPEQMAVDRPRPSRPAPDADGWTVVPPRRGGRGQN